MLTKRLKLRNYKNKKNLAFSVESKSIMEAKIKRCRGKKVLSMKIMMMDFQDASAV